MQSGHKYIDLAQQKRKLSVVFGYQFQYRDRVCAIVDDLFEGAGLDTVGPKVLNELLAHGWTGEVHRAPGLVNFL